MNQKIFNERTLDVPESMPLLSIHEGNPSLQPLISRFLATVEERIKELHSALLTRSLTDLKRVAHKFRGSASTFGFPQVASSIARLEDQFILFHDQKCGFEQVVAAFEKLFHQCGRLCSKGFSCNLDASQFPLTTISENSRRNLSGTFSSSPKSATRHLSN